MLNNFIKINSLEWWANTGLDSWWDNRLPSQQSLAKISVCIATVELKTVHTSMGGSRIEYWAMYVSIT